MEMVFLVGLCIVTAAFIGQQNASMQRIIRVRNEKNERRNR
jgi:hypothetical protein